MSKDFLKCILSFICFVCGLVLTLLFSFHFNATNPSCIIALCLGLVLAAIGVFGFILHYKNLMIIENMKKNKLPILARWSYKPSDFSLVKDKILEDCYVDLSLIVLIGVFCLILAIGLIFPIATDSIGLSILIIISTVILCSLCSILVYFYHVSKLEKYTTALINYHYIYFNNELYSIYRSCYMLEEIEITTGVQNYLRFVYGAPGTPYGPFQIIDIPIPPSELATAYQIKEHYLSLIS
ncbi:hypothetical protein [Zhenhengia yiwuensis]|uniref:Uncharacterized protein n=1 Tax=Zhenhengia yiwuensis TaxID=2763666 RepID=A0A926I8J6_9FIRM|nr:hypothetical protein [Zhenhengia yiwuensis]MBC8578720.1 hypothetical protein [Zhenhengia yiwuensis]MBS5801115.1 hypothetical protein [Clostridiales bacterium]